MSTSTQLRTEIIIPKKRSLWAAIKLYKFYYLLIIPGMLYLFIFHYIPMVGLLIAFKKVAPFHGIQEIITAEWVGFEHFKRFLNSYYFWNVIGNTLIISTYKLIFGFPAPIIFADR